MAVLSPVAKQQFFDNAGNPAAGFKLYTYAANTTTPQATYSNKGGTVANTNPIVLDAQGRATIYIDESLTYDFVLTSATDVTEWTQAGVEGVAQASVAAAAASAEAAAQSVTDAASVADGALATAGIYASTTAGLAATASGGYFSVPSADDNQYLILYKDNAGVAQEIKRYPSASVLSADAEPPSYVSLIRDTAGNVLVWLVDGALDAAALGPVLLAQVRSSLAVASGNPALLKRFAGAVRTLRGSAPTRQAHLWMTGDSWTERYVIPQAFSDDFQALGFPVVATGWVGVQSTGTSDSDGSFRLLDGANLTTTGATLSDASTAVSGEYGPDGMRATFAAGVTTSGFTLYWKGKTLDIYHTLNGATFRHVTDGGANNDVTLANTSAPGKTTITAASEGWHTTVVSRPTATNALVWFGCFASSALPGVIVSKCGNGGSEMHQVVDALASTTAAYVLADVIPTVTVGSVKRITAVRMCWMTNDAIAGDSPASVNAALSSLITAYRTADTTAEILFALPPANGVAGISQGNDIGLYVDGLQGVASDNDVAFVNYYDLWPVYADLGFWADTMHYSATGGGGEATAAHERRTLWEAF